MASETRHFDRVADTTTSTGTGTITLASVAPDTGLITFAQSGLDSVYVHYCITDDAGNWEVGRGFIWNAGTTLNRNSSASQVLASSNANAAVDFVAGTKRVDLVVPASYLDKKVYFSTATPTVNDDYTKGFMDNMMWVCTDISVTKPDALFRMEAGWTGAADWRAIGPIVSRDASVSSKRAYVGNGILKRWDLHALSSFNNNAWAGGDADLCLALGDSANLENRYSLSIGAGKTTSQTRGGGHQGDYIVQGGYTTDATPTDIGYALAKNLVMNENGADNLFIQVVAYSDDGIDCFAKNINALVKIGTGAPTIVAQTSTAVGASAGAASWDVSLGAGTDGPKLTVTGEAARNIRWTATCLRATAHKAF